MSPRTRLDDVHNAPLSAAAEKEGGRKGGQVDLQFLPHNNKVLSQHSIIRSDMHSQTFTQKLYAHHNHTIKCKHLHSDLSTCIKDFNTDQPIRPPIQNELHTLSQPGVP